MLWRSRSHLLVFLALVTPIAMPALAFAQDHAAPAASTAQAPEGAPPTASPAPPARGGTPPSSPAPSSTAPEERPALIPPASAGAAVVSPAMASPAPAAQDVAAPGTQRPDTGEIAAPDHEVFSEDWWGRVHPVVELHGYFRTRGELFQNLGLGRHGSVFQGNDPQYFAPLPLDQSYQDVTGKWHTLLLCGPNANQACFDETESGANMRLRLDPEINISDNLRIVSEIFALDNVILGSTPDAYAIQPITPQTTSTATPASGVKAPAYQSAGYNPYAPIGFFSTTQGAPTAGVNSLQNSINVQRVWGEYRTPVGQLRFGRMPGQWGLACRRPPRRTRPSWATFSLWQANWQES